MIGDLAKALRTEVFIARHSLGARLVILAPALLVMLQALLTRLSVSGAEARDSLLGSSGFAGNDSQTGYGYFVDGLSTGLTMLGLLLVSMAAYSLASERDNGAIRHVLIRRCSRSSVILAKLLNLHLMAALSVILLFLCSYFLNASLWGFEPVVEDGFELISESEITAEIRLGLLLAIAPIPAAIAFGLLVSVSSQTATSAVASALGITLAFDVFKAMLGDYASYIYASFQPSLLDSSYLRDVSRLVRGYSDVLIEPEVIQLNSWVPLPALLLFVIASLVIVQRRQF